MASLHETSARNALQTWMSNPELASVLAEMMQRLSVGEFEDWYTAAICQDFRRTPAAWPMEQVLMFTQMHMDIISGKIGRTELGLWDQPREDSERAANQAALDELPEPFEGYVDPDQYGAEGDGLLRWTEPIQVEVTTGQSRQSASGRQAPVTRVVELEPGQVPLEIGTTMASRTRSHVLQGPGVARWPYGFDRIMVFHNLQHVLPSAVWSRNVARDGCSCHEGI
jgi:hypothetical protein